MTFTIKCTNSLSARLIFKKMPLSWKSIPANWSQYRRNYADKPKTDSISKQIVVQKIHGTVDEPRVRVRRARPADVPRVLRFVRENSRLVWPGLVSNTPGANNNVVLSDYVARTLAQGHSMLAEQQEPKRGWSQIRGIAISTSVCPWDATMLEKWARCMRCARSRKLMLFSAYCLRAPGLHDKYRVHNILQVVLMVPANTPKASEVISMLAKNCIQRGKETGFLLLRFDVTDDLVIKVLNELRLKKEYEFNYEVLPNAIKIVPNEEVNSEELKDSESKGRYITVFTAFPHA